jgi:hypothetical protein
MAAIRERLAWAWWLDSYGGPWRYHLIWAARGLVWAALAFILVSWAAMMLP